jgi:hypothetical protein
MLWNKRGIILVDILEWGHMMNSACYVETVKTARLRPEKKVKIFLQRDNAKPHNSNLTWEITAEFRQTVIQSRLCAIRLSLV